MNEYLGGPDELMVHWFRQCSSLVVLSGCGFREQEQPWRVWMFSLQTMRVRRRLRKLQLCVSVHTGEQLLVVQEVALCGFPSQQTDNAKQSSAGRLMTEVLVSRVLVVLCAGCAGWMDRLVRVWLRPLSLVFVSSGGDAEASVLTGSESGWSQRSF